MSFKVSPDLRCTVNGKCSVLADVDVEISNASTSAILEAFPGSALAGRSKAPFRVLWYMWCAVPLMSVAMSREETPPPSNSTFCNLISPVSLNTKVRSLLPFL